MANMIQCDKCGAVRPYHETYFVKCYRYNEPSKGDYIDGGDLCADCHDELMEECNPTPANLGQVTAKEEQPEKGGYTHG